MKYLSSILVAIFVLLPVSSAWALKECPGSPLKTSISSIPSSWDNCKGEITFKDNPYHGSLPIYFKGD